MQKHQKKKKKKIFYWAKELKIICHVCFSAGNEEQRVSLVCWLKEQPRCKGGSRCGTVCEGSSDQQEVHLPSRKDSTSSESGGRSEEDALRLSCDLNEGRFFFTIPHKSFH